MPLIFLPRIVTDGLVLAIDAANTKSYPGSGTAWYDISRNNNNGSLVNGSTFSSENLGTVAFNGVDQYYNLDKNLDSYTSITANIWLKKPFIVSSNFGVYFAYAANEGDLSLGWGIRNPNGIYPTENEARYQYWAGEGTNLLLYVNGTLISADTSTPNYKISVTNVNLFNTWQYLTLIAEGMSFNTQKILRIAQRTETGDSLTNCTVGSFTVYNRVLSSSEILQNYNATRTRFGL